MYNSKNYIEKPIHLVSINSLGKLVLHFQGINYLKKLKSPISVLSIAGPYRTGKSFLLNSLISSTQNLSNGNIAGPSFEVGHTTNQTTHGLWIWSKPLLAYDENNQITNVVVMDSEGYSSSQSTHDKRLITLAVLLSTCFLFNSKGAIDKDSIFDLEFVIEVARMISQKRAIEDKQGKGTDKCQGKCDFHWILRDFHLELTNELGHKISPDEYMENCLLQAKERICEKTVETLKEYFPQRKCHTLCHPNTEQSGEQRPEFISQILGLKQSILKKNMKSFSMSGESFIDLLESYVQAMNEGEQLQSVFQQGYDCRVRIDCLQKLNHKLKRLQKQHTQTQQIDSRLLNIKSQIKQYYKGRMCSNKQIQVLDSEVQEMIQEYQQEHNSANLLSTSNKVLGTSVKCVDRERHVLNIPRDSGRMVRLSIQCSDNEERSFLGDEDEREDGGRVQRVSVDRVERKSVDRVERMAVERKSVEKQKVSGEVRMLTSKVEQLEVKLHRTELQLNSAEGELTQLKSQNETIRRMLTAKEDELLSMIEKCSFSEKRLNEGLEEWRQEAMQKDKQIKLLQSQIEKMSLLYQEKVEFLQRQIRDADEQRQGQFAIQKSKYKMKVKELTEEISQMRLKHQEEGRMLRDIFGDQESGKIKSLLNLKLQSEGMGLQQVYQQLQSKRTQNSKLQQRTQLYQLQMNKLQKDLQQLKHRNISLQQQLTLKLQQQSKRHNQNQCNLKSLYQSKLMHKQSEVEELESKIRSLTQTASSESSKLIDSLREMESSHSEEKEELFVMNNQLRNGCLEALQRVTALKEQLQVKEQRVGQLEKEKKGLVDKIATMKEENEKELDKVREVLRMAKEKSRQDIQQEKQNIQLLEDQLRNKQQFIMQLQKSLKQSQLQHSLTVHQRQLLTEQLEQLQTQSSSYRQQQNMLQLQNDQKFHQLSQEFQKKQDQIMSLKKLLAQSKNQLEQSREQKSRLIESINQLDKGVRQQYESLQSMFEQKLAHQLSKHQETIKASSSQEKLLLSTIQAKNKEISQLSSNYDKVKSQIQLKEEKNKQMEIQLTEVRQKLSMEMSHYQQNQREWAKNEALLKQKLTFTQMQLNLLKQQTQRTEMKEQQMNEECDNVKRENEGLRRDVCSLQQSLKEIDKQTQQLRQQLQELKPRLEQIYKQNNQQQTLITQLHQTHHQSQQQLQQSQQQLHKLKQQLQQSTNHLHQSKLQHQQSNEQLTTIKNQLSTSQQELVTLRSELQITQKDSEILALNIEEMQQHMRVTVINYENLLRLHAHKLSLVKRERDEIQVKLQQKTSVQDKLKGQYSQLYQNYQQLQHNYTNDFNLWTNKLKQMHSYLIQAGWVDADLDKNQSSTNFKQKNPSVIKRNSVAKHNEPMIVKNNSSIRQQNHNE